MPGTLPVYGGDVRLTLADTNKARLATLIEAIDPNLSNRCSSLTITADLANTGTISLGDSAISTTRYGIKLAAGESFTYPNGSGLNSLSTLNKYLLASVATDKVDVNILVS